MYFIPTAMPLASLVTCWPVGKFACFSLLRMSISQCQTLHIVCTGQPQMQALRCNARAIPLTLLAATGQGIQL